MAANQGDAAAQFSLGMAYAEGNGVEADGEQAAQWFRMADDQGHIAAMYNLAASYSGGFDVDQDYAEAARWYRQAALQGHAQDQNNLGVLYDNGFFFSSGRRHTRWTGDWSSDVCSSDLVDSWGIEPHPFVARVARAKLQWRSSADAYRAKAEALRRAAKSISPDTSGYPPLIYKCYDDSTLNDLDCLRRGYQEVQDDSPSSQLAWLTLVAILRRTSNVGTAQWQYVLPRKQKRSPQDAYSAFDQCVRTFYADMVSGQSLSGPRASFLQADARTCDGVPDGWATLVLT